MTTDELLSMLRDAAELLDGASSGITDPSLRMSWGRRRRDLLDRIRDLEPPEPGSDELLASVMRKLLAADPGHVGWGQYSWGISITVDVHSVDITVEEMQAIDDAAPAS